MSRRSITGHMAWVALAVTLLCSCGAAPKEKDQTVERPRMNMQEAGDRDERLLDESINAVTPQVKWKRYSSNEVACSTGVNEPTGTANVKRSRVITTKISEQRRGAFLGLIERHWKKNGYTLTGADADPEMPSLFAKTPDSFAISVEFGYKGAAYFTITSPCAAESSLTFPAGTPGKPDGPEEKPDPTPSHESDYWSSAGPDE
ncbi:hypothetical protein QIS99_27215 [Streptomyces sp. B-S-A8]|uniref:Lipoprotein n=1 Tax=Streptomyces solicavernae TaxID=3043614 RepID=A0ABT6RZI0_9ACTN|nr:hypothetical protein [Streptomyces sp. B-S-A8]MDI3389853.1 hypothetical protein [Streptomyces sp. B-S-A8]